MNLLEPLDEAVLREAVEAVQEYKVKAAAARALGIPVTTLKNRLIAASKRGVGIVVAPPPRQTSMSVGRLGRKHMIIPDGQNKPDVPMQHWTAIGNYMVAKQPDVVVNLMDFFDMPSLSSYDKGKRSAENRRYCDDIAAGQMAMRMLMKPLQDYNRVRAPADQYHPELHATLGNHEYRIVRATEDNPELFGTLSLDDLGLAEYGWQQHEFLKVVEIDGIAYAHYFISGQKNYPVTSARALATKKHMSCTMGHNQKTDIDMSQVRADGKRIIALFAGCCYLHDEKYLGPQGNADRRGIWMKHEVNDGDYDPMYVSLNYLLRRYA